MENSLESTGTPYSGSGPEALSARLPGKILLPLDGAYDSARSAWNLAVDQRPEVVAYAENALDVIEAVSYARNHGLPIAVQATGHGVIRKADGAVLINTSRMQHLTINPETQTAWVEAGVKWGRVLEAAQLHGLAPLLGSSPDVGAVGYSLGGGMGWLARKYGMSADSILRLEVVTPDGIFRRVSPEENPDLFWALRGGGGGFGVVTGIEIQLYPVAEVYAGNLFYPAYMAKEVFNRFREWVKDAPEDLTTSIVLINFPPLPELPPFLSGQSFVIVRGCYSGPVEEGEKLISYWREWQEPVVDQFRPMPFSNAADISQDPVDPMPTRMSGGWLNDLSDEAVDTLINYTLPQGGPPALVFSEVRLAGGAITRREADWSAYSNRDGQFIWMSIGFPMNPDVAAMVENHITEMRSALGDCLTGKVYMNFLEGEESHRRAKDGFSEPSFQRLREIKARYDPGHLMRFGYDLK
jgi:FAD/FMN-containing dehydrogenase